MATFPRNRITREERVLASKQARAMRGGVIPETPQYASKLPGDSDALRGIPAIGRGVTGAIRDSVPHSVRGSVPERAGDGLDTQSVRPSRLPSAEFA